MEQWAEYIQKRRIKMKQFIILFIATVISSLKLNAQRCIDTVHIKGYYVIKRSANEIRQQIIRKGDVTILTQPVDVHYEPSFIPYDSITHLHLLSYWLNHFFHDTKQVFISCEKFGVKDFAPRECLSLLKSAIDTCKFPSLKSEVLYQTSNLNTGDVFEIYYLDAYWAKVKVKKDSPEVDMIPSKIAQCCINKKVKEFDLYCFIKSDSIQRDPLIKDSRVKIWNKKP
jgi:hypothetical protein